MTIHRTWLTRYEDEARTKLIAREWFDTSYIDESGQASEPLAYTGNEVKDAEHWTVINNNGGSWVGGQFVVITRVERA